MRIPPGWFAEDVTVRPFSGSGPYGDAFGEPFTTKGNVDSRRVLTRNGDGEDLVGESTIHLPPVLPDGTETLDAVPEQSEVTYRERTGVALVVKPYTVRGRLVYVAVTTT